MLDLERLLQQETEMLATRMTGTESQPQEYDGSCLRPLGLCELGGSCDACWYSPTHPRFQQPENKTTSPYR
jgi:hypothetical protein